MKSNILYVKQYCILNSFSRTAALCAVQIRESDTEWISTGLWIMSVYIIEYIIDGITLHY